MPPIWEAAHSIQPCLGLLSRHYQHSLRIFFNANSFSCAEGTLLKSRLLGLKLLRANCEFRQSARGKVRSLSPALSLPNLDMGPLLVLMPVARKGSGRSPQASQGSLHRFKYTYDSLKRSEQMMISRCLHARTLSHHKKNRRDPVSFL